MILKQSTAFTFRIGPFVDDTDGKTAETGLTIGQADIQISKNGGAFAQTSASPTTTHDTDGWYQCPLTATDTGTLGTLDVQIAMAGALPVWRHFVVVPAVVYDSLVAGTDYLTVDAVQIEGVDATNQIRDAVVDDATRIDASALNTLSGHDPGEVIMGATDLGTGAGLTSLATAANLTTLTGYVDTEVAAILAAVDTEVAAIKAKTDNLPASPAAVGSAMTLSAGAITSGSFAAGAIDAAAIAADAIGASELAADAAAEIGTAVWASSTRTLSSFGTLVTDIWAAGTRTLTSAADSAGVTTLLSRIVGTLATGTHNPQSGDAYARLGAPAGASVSADVAAVKAQTAAIEADTGTDGVVVAAASKTGYSLTATTGLGNQTANITGNLSGSVGSVTGAVGSVTGAVGSVTGAVTVGTNNDKTGYALSSAGVQAIWDALTSALTTVGSVGKRIADNLDGTVSSRSSHSAADVWAAATRTLTSAADSAGVTTLLSRIVGTLAAGTHNAQSGDAYARLGAPAGASVSADVAAVKAQTAAIEADTQDLQTQVGTDGAGLTALPWNAAWDAEVQSEAADALAAYDPPTKAELDSAVAPLATAAALDAVDNYVDTEIAAIKAKTDNLPSDPADQSAVEAAITAATSTLATAANLATLAGYVDTEVAAIKAKTDNLPASPAAVGSAMTLTAAYDAAKTAATQASVDDLPTNAELATALAGADDAVLAAVAALNNLSSAQAQTAAAAALTAYDPPTNAEMEARTLVAANYATAAALDAVDNYVDTEVAAIKAVTDKLDTALVLDGAVYQLTANALELAPTGGSAPSAATIASAVRTELATELGRINVPIDSRLAPATAGRTLDVDASGNAAANVTYWAGVAAGAMPAKVADLPAAAPTAAVVRAEIDANSVRLAAIQAKTDNLPAAPADDTSIDSQLAAIAGYLDTEVAAILAAVDTEVAAIKAKTDNLPSDPADQSELLAAIAGVGAGSAPTKEEIRAEIDANSVRLAAIQAKTDNLPSDPADQSTVEAAITAATSPLATAAALAVVDANVDAVKLITDTLDVSAVTQVAASNAGHLTITAARTFNEPVTGLTIPATWVTALWTLKADASRADTAALVQLRETNPAALTDGLVRLNGAAVASPLTAASGALTVTQASGRIDIYLTDELTALLDDATGLGWDVKFIDAAGDSTGYSGTSDVVLTETKATV